MSTILSKSVQGKNLKNFRTLRWMSSNNLPDTATFTTWQILTPYHKFRFIELLKMKNLLFELDKVEYACLIDAPGVLTDELYVSAMIAKSILKNKEVLLQRLNILQRFLNKLEYSDNLYYSLVGRSGYEIREIRSATRKATKFSGYVRNASAVGSKSSRGFSIPEPESVEWDETVKIDFLNFLTVGESTLGTPGGHFFTLMRAKSSKRKPDNKLL